MSAKPRFHKADKHYNSGLEDEINEMTVGQTFEQIIEEHQHSNRPIVLRAESANRLIVLWSDGYLLDIDKSARKYDVMDYLDIEHVAGLLGAIESDAQAHMLRRWSNGDFVTKAEAWIGTE